jgi:hypothetical protein
MPTPTDYSAVLRRPEGIDRLVAEGVPLCRIEEMLDELEYEAARYVSSIRESRGWIGHLLWS